MIPNKQHIKEPNIFSVHACKMMYIFSSEISEFFSSVHKENITNCIPHWIKYFFIFIFRCKVTLLFVCLFIKSQVEHHTKKVAD